MLSLVTALRAGRPRPSYAQARHSDLRLGLPRRPRLAASGRPSRLHPHAAVRAAARSLTRPAPRPTPLRLALRRSTQVRWTRRTVDLLRATREGSAAAWRA